MIHIYSREQMEQLYKDNPNDNTPVISINDIGYMSPVPDNHDNVLRLWFDDVTPYLIKHNLIHPYYLKEAQKRSLVLFDDAMAKDVREFVYTIASGYFGNEMSLYVHCYAGVSRSTAIALGIHTWAPEVFGRCVGVDFNDCRMNSFVFGKLYKEMYYAL